MSRAFFAFSALCLLALALACQPVSKVPSPGRDSPSVTLGDSSTAAPGVSGSTDPTLASSASPPGSTDPPGETCKVSLTTVAGDCKNKQAGGADAELKAVRMAKLTLLKHDGTKYSAGSDELTPVAKAGGSDDEHEVDNVMLKPGVKGSEIKGALISYSGTDKFHIKSVGLTCGGTTSALTANPVTCGATADVFVNGAADPCKTFYKGEQSQIYLIKSDGNIVSAKGVTIGSDITDTDAGQLKYCTA